MFACMTDLFGETQKKKGGGGLGYTNRGAARVLTSKLLPFHISTPFLGSSKILPGGFVNSAIMRNVNEVMRFITISTNSLAQWNDIRGEIRLRE